MLTRASSGCVFFNESGVETVALTLQTIISITVWTARAKASDYTAAFKMVGK